MTSKTAREVNNYLKSLIIRENELISCRELEGISVRNTAKKLMHHVIEEKLYMTKEELYAYVEFQLVYNYLCEFYARYPYMKRKTLSYMLETKSPEHIEGIEVYKWKHYQPKDYEFEPHTQEQVRVIKEMGYAVQRPEYFSSREAGRCIRYLLAAGPKPAYFNYFLSAADLV